MEDEAKLVARMFNSMAGLNGVASSSVFSSAVGGLRNLMTSAMLGTSVLTATSDGQLCGQMRRRWALPVEECGFPLTLSKPV